MEVMLEAKTEGTETSKLERQLEYATATVALTAAVASNFNYLTTQVDLGNPTSVAMAALSLIQMTTFALFASSNTFNADGKSIDEKLDEIPDDPIAIVIPTINESIDILKPTIDSIARQSYRFNRHSVICISNDNRTDLERAELIKNLVANAQFEHPDLTFRYHEPPTKDSPLRNGQRKAGNLNSAVPALLAEFPTLKYICTQDADDQMPDENFLAKAVAHMNRSPQVGFVQGIKATSGFDVDQFFYKIIETSKGKQGLANSCGSGVVYSANALKAVNFFPGKPISEDTAVSLEMFRAGYRGDFLNTVGAFTNYPPKELNVLLKQRKTWTEDTFRNGLNLMSNIINGTETLPLKSIIGLIEQNVAYISAMSFSVAGLLTAASFLNIIPPITAPAGVDKALLINLGQAAFVGSYFAIKAKQANLTFKEVMGNMATYSGLTFGYWEAFANSFKDYDGNHYVTEKKKEGSGDKRSALRHLAPNIIFTGLLLAPMIKGLIDRDLDAVYKTINLLPYVLMNSYFIKLSLDWNNNKEG